MSLSDIEAARVEGLRKLDRQLAALGPAYKRKIKDVLEKNAAEMASAARVLAPVDAGPGRRKDGEPHLRDTITIERDRDDRLSLRVVVKAFYGRFVEFGTDSGVRGTTKVDRTRKGRRKVRRTHPGTAPQPFFFPAWRALRPRLKSRLSRAIRQAAAEAARRG